MLPSAPVTELRGLKAPRTAIRRSAFLGRECPLLNAPRLRELRAERCGGCRPPPDRTALLVSSAPRAAPCVLRCRSAGWALGRDGFPLGRLLPGPPLCSLKVLHSTAGEERVLELGGKRTFWYHLSSRIVHLEERPQPHVVCVCVGAHCCKSCFETCPVLLWKAGVDQSRSWGAMLGPHGSKAPSLCGCGGAEGRCQWAWRGWDGGWLDLGIPEVSPTSMIL